MDAYLAAHRVRVENDPEMVVADDDPSPGICLPDGGALCFRFFNGGLISLYVELSLGAAAELATLMRLGNFIIADEELFVIQAERRVIALSESAAAAAPASIGKARVVAPGYLAGALYDWAAEQMSRHARGVANYATPQA